MRLPNYAGAVFWVFLSLWANLAHSQTVIGQPTSNQAASQAKPLTKEEEDKAYEAFSKEIDSAETRQLAEEIESRVRDEREAEYNDLIYYYSGPFAWSKPDVRIVIKRGSMGEVTYYELEQHRRMVAYEMRHTGATNIDFWIKKGAKAWIQTDKAKCPAAVSETRALLNLVREVVRSTPANVDSPPGDPGRIRVDGGSVHRFIFGTQELNTFSYSLQGNDKAILDALAKLKAAIVACKN